MSQEKPSGKLQLRTIAMPGDTNSNGDIFGGWIMAQMDIAGAILAKEVSQTRTVTVAVEGMKFLKPVKVGDIVSCYGDVTRKGNTSITIKLEVWIKSVLKNLTVKVTEATFIYVAIDQDGKKITLKK
ncbi:MAG: cytosolic long-chain acyl-CoA thioester hydrolase family protein [uncultured Campylobacterales bacterium]|uniref:Cytosolic long-chain acyl-CoA thioester hydrolase family protein n=1 Tax=uncultured Campylobacterales bacterium TaxID=352960 RepID=A0A6S6S556_9BACT|nr:MAG: cytosolic long-chain acyl-CoA thioester hydrolase family protein [uncultured Campylobacterales bacterium]